MFQPEPRFLFAYCERLGQAGFWAEPLNAITNAAFLIAAAIGLVLWLRQKPRDWALIALVIVVAAIGIGSFLFHTIPNRVTVMLDVLPIQLFILAYFGLAVRRYLGLPLWAALVAPALFFAASAGFISLVGSRALGGGVGYVPALAALFVFAGLTAMRGGSSAKIVSQYLALAGLVFVVSLTFRTLDQPACTVIPFGLHFLWHVLNACVLGLLLLALERQARMNGGGTE
ncbi:MAG: ceramidase domain-containing protein [Rhabdaerophilum sp.]